MTDRTTDPGHSRALDRALISREEHELNTVLQALGKGRSADNRAALSTLLTRFNRENPAVAFQRTAFYAWIQADGRLDALLPPRGEDVPTPPPPGSFGGGGYIGGGMSIHFGFDEAEFEASWSRIKAQIESSFQFEDTDTVAQEAGYWAWLEEHLLQDYTARLKALSLSVARMEKMVASYTNSFEASFNAAFGMWASHYNERVDAQLNNRINIVIDEEVEAYFHNDAELVLKITDVVNNKVKKQFETKVTAIETKLRSELKATIEQKIKEHGESYVNVAIVKHRETLHREITQLVQQSVKLRVDNSIKAINVDLDIDGFRIELNRVLEQVLRVRGKIEAHVQQEISRLTEWVVSQVIELKGCLTDREALVGLLATFSASLEAELSKPACVITDPDKWTIPGLPQPIPYQPVEPVAIPTKKDKFSFKCKELSLVPQTTTAGSSCEVTGPIPAEATVFNVQLELDGVEPFRPDEVTPDRIRFTVPAGARSGNLTLVSTGGGKACTKDIRIVEDNPFVVPVRTGRGLLGNVYLLDSSQKEIPDYGAMEAATSVTTPNLDVAARNFTEGFPGVTGTGGATLTEYFGIRFTSGLVIEEAGEYTFQVTADDAAKLSIDGDKVLDWDLLRGRSREGTFEGKRTLEAGRRDFRLDYMQGPGNSLGLVLKWKRPGRSEFEVVPPEAFERDLGAASGH